MPLLVFISGSIVLLLSSIYYLLSSIFHLPSSIGADPGATAENITWSKSFLTSRPGRAPNFPWPAAAFAAGKILALRVEDRRSKMEDRLRTPSATSYPDPKRHRRCALPAHSKGPRSARRFRHSDFVIPSDFVIRH
jgi:hypothetical protein